MVHIGMPRQTLHVMVPIDLVLMNFYLYCAGEYRTVVDKIEEHTSSLLAICKSQGLRLPTSRSHSIQQHFPADSVKFFLKEKQKLLEDLSNTERAGL